jgi:hypothetical protein
MYELFVPLALAFAAAVTASTTPPRVEARAVIERSTPLSRSARFAPDAVVSAYANLTTFVGYSLLNGGVASNAIDTSTLFVADDLVPDPSYGGAYLTSVRFTVANDNPDSVTLRVGIRLLNPDGPSGKPGSLIMGIDADGLKFPPLTLSVIAVKIPPGVFPMPGGLFWAGMSFDDHGGTWNVTPAQLSNFGQGYFDPPTVGSSQNRLFISSDPFTMDGTIQTRTGQPAYDFGWEFNVDASTPTRVATWGRLKSLYR